MNHPLHDIQGEQKQQRLVLVDVTGREIGTDTREACHRGKGKTHRAFMAFLITPDRRLLLTQRSKEKSLWAGYWDASVVSHVLPGESSVQAASRRAQEELGISMICRDIGAFYYFAAHGDSAENEYCHVLIGRSDDSVHANAVEIAATQYIPLDQFRTYVQANAATMAPWLLLVAQKFDIAQLA